MEVTSDLTLYASWSRNRDGATGSGNSSSYVIQEGAAGDLGSGGIYTITFVMNGYSTQLPPLTNMAALPTIPIQRQDARAHFDG